MSSDSLFKIEQISILTKLVSKFCDRNNTLECIKLAKDLENVIEELNFYNIDLSELSNEFLSIFPEHWKQRTQFLLIVTKYWPQILQDLGKTNTDVSGGVCCKMNEYPTLPRLEDLLKNKTVNISETKSIYEEIEQTIEIIKQYPNRRISVISPNESYSFFLTQKLKANNIEYVSYISNEEVSDEFVDKVKLHFRDYLKEIPLSKLIKELSKFSDVKKEPKKLQIFGVNNYICNGEVLICAELNELYWHYKECGIFWLHPIIRKKFNIESDNKKIEAIFYKAIKDNRKIYLLRAQSSNGQNLRKSFLLSEFEAKCKKQQIKINYQKFETKSARSILIQNNNDIDRGKFKMPQEMSVKSLERLIKDPLAFYANNILNLTPKDKDDKKFDLSIASKDLLYRAFMDDAQLGNKLDYIKSLDFFTYRKCLNVMDFINKKKGHQALNNISGEIEISNLGIRLYGYCDRIELNDGEPILITYKTSTPKPTKELLYGDEISALTNCLIAQKGGFKGLHQPVKSIQIWNIMPGKEIVSIKELEISSEMINDFEKRLISKLSDILNQEKVSTTLKKQKYNLYKHFERT